MEHKNLGKTQILISAIGQGTIGAGSHSSATPERIRKRIEVILAGIEEGITFLDTGEDYEEGHAEEILGRAVKGTRKEVFISTKFKPVNNTYAGVLKAAEMSLRRLGTDYIDLYQMHWPNPQVALSETLEAMLKLVEHGKVRFIGVSNVTYQQLKDARQLSSDKLVSLQTEYNLFNRDVEKDILPYCKNEGLTLIAYSPFSRWKLSLRSHEKAILEGICRKYAVSIPQVILNWLIAHKNVNALTQTMSLEHIRENGRAVNFTMDEEDIEKIEKAFSREPVFVPTERIRVLSQDADETHCIYTSLDDAISNVLNIQPSPAAIADELKEGSILRPVELITTGDKSGHYEYDLTHGRMRYWAWIIAYGSDSPIPAYVIDSKQ